jgi:hypothetical protein
MKDFRPLAHPDQQIAFAEVANDARTLGFRIFEIDRIPIAGLLNFFQRTRYYITQTQLTIKRQATEMSRKTTLSKIYCDDSFPFHTDYAYKRAPPQFIIIANETNLSFDRPSYVAPFPNVLADLLSPLRDARWIVNNNGDSFLVSSRQTVKDQTLLRWDADFLIPHNRSALECLSCVPAYFETVKSEINWPAQTAVVINNWSCAHARGNRISQADDLIRNLTRYEVWCHAGMV